MPDEPAIDLLDDYTGYLLRLAHVHAERKAAEAFPDGPHPRLFAVLSALAEAGPLSQQRLAERLRVNRTSMVAAADALERDGLVERRRDPADRRSYALHMTDAGLELLASRAEEVAGADEALTEALDARERARLNDLLRQLVTSDPERHIPERLADRSGFLISIAHLMMRDRSNELLAPRRMLVRHIGLLSVLDARGPSAQHALARRLSVSPTMITQIVDEAEARGLVERRRNPADRRSYLVSLTGEGREQLAAGRALARQLSDEIAGVLGADGDRELRALLRKLTGTER
jgi:DNA-binding MarR family transcriptional regulator